jgi:hypothetical protein
MSPWRKNAGAVVLVAFAGMGIVLAASRAAA